MVINSPTLVARARIYGAVALSILGGITATLLVRSIFGETAFLPDRDALGNYLQLIGGIYAVVIGFVIFVVWNQFNDGTRAIEHEAGRLGSLGRLCSYLGDKSHASQIRRAISNYANEVLENWRASEAGNREILADSPGWRALAQAVRLTPTRDEREAVVYSDMLRQLDQLTSLRNERFSIFRARIPWILWDLLLFASIVTFLPLCVLHIESVFIDSLIAGSTSGALVFLLLVVRDLDDPYLGVFNVSFEPFEKLLTEVELDSQSSTAP